MRLFAHPAVAILVCLLCASTAGAQALPTATGRQFTLSNSAWKLFIPSNYFPRGNVADILVHFHGDPQTVWNNAKYANLNALIVTANHGTVSSHFSTPFSNTTNPTAFQTLLNDALSAARAQADIPDTLQFDKLAVSSFSAGYGAVREILKSTTYRNDIDMLLAADSLYATTAGDGTPLDSQMVDYKTFATQAKNGTKTFLFTHSQVLTYTYENTKETGDELMQHLGMTAPAVNTPGLGTLVFNRYGQSGNFHLWGATGADAAAHSKHLQYIGDFFEELPLAKIPAQGDYNADGLIDAADYVIWRKTNGSTTNLLANGDTSGASALMINAADYAAWMKQYSNGGGGGSTTSLAAAPEPSAWLIPLFVATCASLIARVPKNSLRHRVEP
jgi:hypothetical protein